ncbi:uncharacterized protein LOC124134380 [Haliotis rufescens]|uniref:uncharacterized protein LOC124134380 n=1 Tax=Haliotis rufescens TaxID=6454 RepID=UPI001EB07681|nr:uncharacterized protein LOC124134380 [Haliotis rufescens]
MAMFNFVWLLAVTLFAGQEGEAIPASLCSAQKKVFPNFVNRWPTFNKGSNPTDDTVLSGVYSTPDQSHLLHYPPGVNKCGAEYSIWRKSYSDGISVMCVQSEENECFESFRIESEICGYAYEVYNITTNIRGSAFCLQPNFCRVNPCADGVECRNGRDGFMCDCDWFERGPFCNGDPCENYRQLPDMDKRVVNYTDYFTDDYLQNGWYVAPPGMETLTTKPASTPACGSHNPLFSGGRSEYVELMCTTVGPEHCNSPLFVLRYQCPGPMIFGVFHKEMAATFCFECRPEFVDLLIMLDLSSSVVKEDYDTVMEFVQNIINRTTISNTTNQVALISFGRTTQVDFTLNKYDSVRGVLAGIGSEKRLGGGTHMADSFKLAQQTIFKEANGDRPGFKNRVLFISDGRVKDTDLAMKYARKVHAVAEVYGVGVTDSLNTRFFYEFVSQPASGHAMHMSPQATGLVESFILTNPECYRE